jgi:hypothetical protein
MWGSNENRTVNESGAMPDLYAASEFALGNAVSGFFARSNVKTTSRAVVGRPSCQRTSRRRWNTIPVSPSSSHRSARAGS